MDRNNRIWSGKRIVSLCLILCLTFSTCLTYVSGTSAYAAEITQEVSQEDLGEMDATTESTTDDADDRDTQQEHDGTGEDDNADAADTDSTQEEALPANVLYADNEDQRGEQLKKKLQEELRAVLKNEALDEEEPEVATPVALTITRDTDFPEGTSAIITVYEPDSLADLWASLDQYLTQYDQPLESAGITQVLRTKVDNVCLPLNIQLLDTAGDNLDQTGKLTIRTVPEEEILFEQLYEAWQQGTLLLYHLKDQGKDSEEWEVLDFTMQPQTEGAEGYLEFMAESLSPFLFVQTEQVVTEVTAEQTGADTDDANGTNTEDEEGESENTSETERDNTEAGDDTQDEEMIYPSFTSGIWPVKNGYEPIWEESDFLTFDRERFINGTESITARFYSFLKGNIYNPEGNADATDQEDAKDNVDGISLVTLLGLGSDDKDEKDETSVTVSHGDAISYTLTEDTFYLEGELLEDDDYDLTGLEWICGTDRNEAEDTLGNTDTDMSSTGLNIDSEEDSLELVVASGIRQALTIWIRPDADTQADGDTKGTGAEESWTIAAIYNLENEAYQYLDYDWITGIDGKQLSFAEGVKGVRLTTQNEAAESHLSMYVDTTLQSTDHVTEQLSKVAEFSLTDRAEMEATKDNTSLFSKIEEATVWFVDASTRLEEDAEAGALTTAESTVMSAAIGIYTVTFDAGTSHQFDSNASTNALLYNIAGEVIYGTYQEPKDTAATFAGWYDAQTGGNKYDIDADGNISPAPSGNMTLYAHYIESTRRYAVSIFGIGVDEMADGEAGITFGPAMGDDYVYASNANGGYKSHDPANDVDAQGNLLKTEAGNAYRCIHDDSWSTIVAWNEEDPYVYANCIANGCTHSVMLEKNETTSIISEDFLVNEDGDGVGIIANEIYYNNTANGKYNLTATTEGGWGMSNVRSLLNGADNGTYANGNCLLGTFPEELRNAIGEKVVKYDSTAGAFTEENLKQSYDKLWLFSTNELAEECTGLGAYSHPLEGSVYEKLNGFTSASTVQRKVTYIKKDDFSTVDWGASRLRSIYDGTVVHTIGGYGALTAVHSSITDIGVSPGFTLVRNSRADEEEYKITFDANGKTFSTNESTNVLGYNKSGELVYGVYQEPKDSAATFAGWYDAQTGGNKYDIDLDGNISPAPSGNMTLYAQYDTSNMRYAVCVYDIGVDEMASGEAGLTFGPATGESYIVVDNDHSGFVEHIPTGETVSGNAHRCIHNDSWSTIVAWNEKDPYVYEQCITNGCTHRVTLNENSTTSILNQYYTADGGADADGVSILFKEVYYEDRDYNGIWNLTNDTTGGWGASNIRAMLNGTGRFTSSNCLLATFPEELRNAIGSKVVKYDSVGEAYTQENLRVSYDKLWLFSTNELADDCSGLGTSSHPLEGTVYQKFKNTDASSNLARSGYWVVDYTNNTLVSSGGYVMTRSLCGGNQVIYEDNIGAFYNSAGAFATNPFNGIGNFIGFTLVRNDKSSEAQYTVTFDANGETFATNESTNIIKYNKTGEKVYGIYMEPKDTAATFAGWYDAQTGGNKYDIDADGNISPAPTSDITLYAKYTEETGYRYAVCVYDIGVDTLTSGEAGLTVGPAFGTSYVYTYKNHSADGVTSAGNLHRCFHEDSWSTIVAWNEKDPEVYEQCIEEGCTHSIMFDSEKTSMLFSSDPSKEPVGITGDGFTNLSYLTSQHWNISDTTAGGWGQSNARALLNGVAITNSVANAYDSNNCLLIAFPEELQKAIGTRVVKYDSVAEALTEENLKISEDKLWLLSANEVVDNSVGAGLGDLDHPLEGQVYRKFVGKDVTYNKTGYWWDQTLQCDRSGYTNAIRSIYSNTDVIHIGNDGELRHERAAYDMGLAPCFTLVRDVKDSDISYKVTFDANGEAFLSGESTNVLTYDEMGERLSGYYQEPLNTAATFAGWYDAQTGGNKYDIDVDGNISPLPTGDMTLYAQYVTSNMRYAVCVYGIGVDEMASGEAGLTLGPATEESYLFATETNLGYKEHTPTGATTSGNAHRCLHNDSWSTIVAWNEKDPYVYEQCLEQGCTHSVQLSKNETSSVWNNAYTATITGDGVAAFAHELASDDNRMWNRNMDTTGGWAESRVRAMFNGVTNVYGGTEFNVKNCVLASFPEELQSAIGERVVKFNLKAGDFTDEENLGVTYDKLWLFSTNELADDCSLLGAYSHSLEGKVYPKFEGTTTDATSKRRMYLVKYRENGEAYASDESWLWTRSIYDGANAHNMILTELTSSGGVNKVVANGIATIAIGFTLVRNSTPETKKLTISNTVEGNQGNKAKDFSYELQLISASGNQISGEVAYTKVDFSGNTTTGTLSATNGVYAFSLAHGEYICFEGIPQNCSYGVSETANSSKGYKVTCDKPTGTLSANMRVAFTNTKNGAIPTLAVTGIGILLGLGLAALVLLLIVRRKRKNLYL